MKVIVLITLFIFPLGLLDLPTCSSADVRQQTTPISLENDRLGGSGGDAEVEEFFNKIQKASKYCISYKVVESLGE